MPCSLVSFIAFDMPSRFAVPIVNRTRDKFVLLTSAVESMSVEFETRSNPYSTPQKFEGDCGVVSPQRGSKLCPAKRTLALGACCIGLLLPPIHRLLFIETTIDDVIPFFLWFAPIHAFTAYCAVARPWYSTVCGLTLCGSLCFAMYLLDGRITENSSQLLIFAIADWLYHTILGVLILGIIVPAIQFVRRGTSSHEEIR